MSCMKEWTATVIALVREEKFEDFDDVLIWLGRTHADFFIKKVQIRHRLAFLSSYYRGGN